MKKYCVIGEKLSHTMSPQIHNEFFKIMNIEATYDVVEIAMSDIDLPKTKELLKQYDGINVTVPYKQNVMKHLDWISEEALEIGAVNTIKNVDGKLYGYNSDPYGFEKMLTYNNIEPLNKDCIVLGAGGAAKSLIYYLKKVVKNVKVVSRNKKNTFNGVECITYNELKKENGYLLVNATPVGMFPKVNDIPVKENIIKNFDCIVDIIYNPLLTKFLEIGLSLNKKCVSGFYMLVAQAMKSQSIWQDKEISIDVINQIFNKLEINRKKTLNSNIYLTGMMGSGKSVIGKRLAKMLNWEYVDLDNYISYKYKKSIPEMFEKGEQYFRECETEALLDYASKRRVIVSTGGGTITRSINRDIMKLTGIILFRDRKPKDILSTMNYSKRPLIKEGGEKAFYEIYNNRYELYKNNCDYHLNSIGIDEDLNTIMEWMKYEN